MSKLALTVDYLNYIFTSKTKHGIHSPFVYQMVTDVFNVESRGQKINETENLRRQLLTDNRTIEILDLGAGSKTNNLLNRKVSDIAKNSLKSKKYGQLLYRLSKHFRPENMLELGTSLGISSLYMALANPKGTLTTIEGSPEIATIAGQHFEQSKAINIKLITGNFDDILPAYLSGCEKVDLVFFDGNHRQEATLNYFQQCLEKCHNDSLFIFDDIYWSTGMKQAWQQIKNNPAVTVTIDLFFMGLVFFRKQQEKQHFKIRY